MNTISFMSANFVARQLNYQMTEGWTQGESATNEYFRPLESFAERFAGLLNEITAMGFTAIDIWTAHLNPQWATAGHIASALDLLGEHGLQVTTLAGDFGNTVEEFATSCRLAHALGTDILGGHSGLLGTDRSALVSILQAYGCRLGVENDAERTPQELLEKIGDGGNGAVGACVDTGMFGTHGFDAVFALVELRNHLIHIHLKDVLAVGTHQTCRYGKGVVPIEKCVETLRRLGYTGAISVEHEPAGFDPTEDCKANLRMLRRWLAKGT